MHRIFILGFFLLCTWMSSRGEDGFDVCMISSLKRGSVEPLQKWLADRESVIVEYKKSPPSIFLKIPEFVQSMDKLPGRMRRLHDTLDAMGVDWESLHVINAFETNSLRTCWHKVDLKAMRTMEIERHILILVLSDKKENAFGLIVRKCWKKPYIWGGEVTLNRLRMDEWNIVDLWDIYSGDSEKNRRRFGILINRKFDKDGIEFVLGSPKSTTDTVWTYPSGIEAAPFYVNFDQHGLVKSFALGKDVLPTLVDKNVVDLKYYQSLDEEIVAHEKAKAALPPLSFYEETDVKKEE